MYLGFIFEKKKRKEKVKKAGRDTCARSIFSRTRHRDVNRMVKSRDEHDRAWRASQGSPIKGRSNLLQNMKVRTTLSQTLDLHSVSLLY